jgi:hypothetical protein
LDDVAIEPFELGPMISPEVTELCIQLSTLHHSINWMKMMEAAANVIDKTKTEI